MHTGLRIKVTVKEDFLQMINKINNEESYFTDYIDQFSFLTNFAKLKRSALIPSGVSAYMPTGWEIGEYPNEQATDGFERQFNMDTGFWSFQCCLKNYDNIIEHFLTDVLANIIESSEHIETKHEEDDESELFEYVNGEIVRAAIK
ncbi:MULTISPECIES: hypothetical protein [Bacillati]|uniref:hypothetical protein n=1 Tax=Bacillati TaxID=1783272 RepID=UPI000B9AD0D2|nr:hypothetical protein [Rhodococcus sp. 15-2388-1-1a]OZE89091.1 hypothetical protein CH302_29445 [Rhodococcus sp. 15-2388-1-1a]